MYLSQGAVRSDVLGSCAREPSHANDNLFLSFRLHSGRYDMHAKLRLYYYAGSYVPAPSNTSQVDDNLFLSRRLHARWRDMYRAYFALGGRLFR